MNEKKFNANYEIYRTNKSLKYWGLAYLFGAALLIATYILHGIFNFNIHNPSIVLCFPFLAAAIFISLITGKIALKTRNLIAIIQFILYSFVTIWGTILIYFAVIDEFLMSLKLFILFAVILIIFVYIIEKKFKQGRYGSGFIPGDYRNIIIKEAEQIAVLTDGYSMRPFSKEYAQIKSIENFKNKAGKFAKFLGKEGVIMDWNWNFNKNSITLFPPIFIDDLFLPVSYAISLMFRKNKLSWVKISSNGQVTVFISDENYKRTTRPVAHHILCQNIAGKFEESFVEFAKGGENNKINSIKILRGEK